ncbi:hypothetical protein C5167_034027 [Papaver somniferum]|uniref:Uncharacterized protein n=1 Tax=Papaver somniferum TaxID=3469 RepID=A0A4Y7KCG4_PAPSO|nr:uncharacterized protein LOC113298673 isoform X2 [Papaver somniferum]RZC70526.1 hypothetical protein C5167_034027 [Papaver somniferum]
MASVLQIAVQNSCLQFSTTNRSIKLRRYFKSTVLDISGSAKISQISTFSLPVNSHNLTIKHISRASPEEIPGELHDDSKFVPLNAEDLQYGPPALLLLGFAAEETGLIQQFLKAIGGEFLKVVHCTEDMITRSLWEAINTEQPNLEEVQIAKSVPRVCFLSGLTGEEMMMLIEEFPEIGLEPVVFAALVPNSADKLLQEVVEEVIGDHEMMIAQQSDST